MGEMIGSITYGAINLIQLSPPLISYLLWVTFSAFTVVTFFIAAFGFGLLADLMMSPTSKIQYREQIIGAMPYLSIGWILSAPTFIAIVFCSREAAPSPELISYIDLVFYTSAAIYLATYLKLLIGSTVGVKK